jgi:hypothetical protein
LKKHEGSGGWLINPGPPEALLELEMGTGRTLITLGSILSGDGLFDNVLLLPSGLSTGLPEKT